MAAGRRGFLLCVAFLGLVAGLTRHAQAQPQPNFYPVDPKVGTHDLWRQNLTPDQIREKLGRFGVGTPQLSPLEKMVLDALKDKYPNSDPKQREAAAKKILGDKELMDRLTDLAQKYKNQGKTADDFKLSQKDLDQIKKSRPPGDDPFKVPDRPPATWNPDNLDPNQFDTKSIPKFDPRKFDRDPNTGFPLDPKTGKPFDPRDGSFLDPKQPPKIDPGTKRPIDPNTGKPFDPFVKPKDPDPVAKNPNPVAKNPDPKVAPPPPPEEKQRFDPKNPLGDPNQTPEQKAKSKALDTATALWEKNVGPLDETPAVKRAIEDLINDDEAFNALTDGKGNSIFDMLNGDGEGGGFGDLFNDGGSGGFNWPKLDFGFSRPRVGETDYQPPRSGPRSPSLSGPDVGGSFNFGSFQIPWVLFLALVALIVGLLLWWKWGAIFTPKPAAASADGGLDLMPFDPRDIETREDIVKAFEYLSVLLIGPGAKTWTHSTIAEELSSLVSTHGETAVKLARLYELARYAPLDEPLTRAELAEARRLACELAGVNAV